MLDESDNFTPKGLETFRPLAILMLCLALAGLVVYVCYRRGGL